MLEFWQYIQHQLTKQGKVALMIVLSSKGSSPGRAGFKMAVGTDGTMKGSVGGGRMEFLLVEKCRQLLENGSTKTQIEKKVHQAKAGEHSSGMICSGEQIIATLILNKNEHIHLFNQICDALESNAQLELQLINGELNLAHSNSGFTQPIFQENEGAVTYRERLGFAQIAFVIGGGHVGLAVSEMMRRLDFFVVNIDDREALNTMQVNKYAHQKVIADYTELAKHVISGPSSYVILVSHGFKSDEACLEQLVDKSFAYLGMMGSKTKIAKLLKNMQRKGFSDEQLAQVHTPIGLKINSKTPAEIAVSIAAEIIEIKNRS